MTNVDPYLWLEDVESQRALDWVRARNAESRHVLEAWPPFETTRQAVREVLDARDRIPAVTRRGEHVYNFWQDAANPRGVWRRALVAEFKKDEPAWEVLLDIDALARDEGVNWTFAGANCLSSTEPAERNRCLVQLSRGGADATQVREFDLATRRFVPSGFALAEAKSQVDWLDRDTLLVGTDTGPGSMTESGYPRQVRRWQRGTPLSEATLIHEGQASDVYVYGGHDATPGFERTLIYRARDFYNTDLWLLVRGEGDSGERLISIDKPSDANLSFWREHVLIELRSDWLIAGQRFAKGSLLAGNAAAYLGGERVLQALFTPTASRSLSGYTTTRHHLLLTVMEHVSGRVEAWRPPSTPGSAWTRRDVQAPSPGSLTLASWHDPLVANDPLGDAYTITYKGFLQPDTLYRASAGSDADTDAGADTRDVLKARRPQFDSTGMRVEQRFASSQDGTRVPYFVVWPQGAIANGRNPTLLYGYGGFEVSLEPWYSGVYGRAWLARGGVLVVANIRGGGEYGPAWHQAALRENRQRAFDDFAAVAEDLIRAGITAPQHLGMAGGSNGGLLVGSVMLQRPDLFGAVVCSVPLLDMKRYHKLLAGASWMAEYGNPDDPADWAFLERYSPYQNVKASQKLPPVLFATSTRDDRVHPGHARKMAARMIEQGHRVAYWENIEGGHGGAADNAQRADMMTIEFAFLWQHLAP